MFYIDQGKLKCANDYKQKPRRCGRWRPARTRCSVGPDSVHPRHLPPTRENMEETLLRWAVRRDQHKDPTLTPQPAVRKSYEEWHARYYLNPKHVAHSMRAALESVVQRSLRRNALYDIVRVFRARIGRGFRGAARVLAQCSRWVGAASTR